MHSAGSVWAYFAKLWAASMDSIFPATEPPSDWSDQMPSRVEQWDELPEFAGVCEPCPFPQTCSAREACEHIKRGTAAEG